MEKLHQLIIRETKGQSWAYTLGNNQVKIGRSRTCELRIPDPRISREHCVIRKFNNKYFVADLDSRNGFTINGIPEKEKELMPNDRITIGFTSIHYVVQEEQKNDILITQDEPNETFSFTLDLDSKANIHQANQNTLMVLQKLLQILNEEEDIRFIAEKITPVLKQEAEAVDCAVVFYDTYDVSILSEYKSSEIKIKISKKILSQVIETQEAFYLMEEDNSKLNKVILPLFSNAKIACVLIILTLGDIKENEDLQHLYTIISKLLSISFKRQMKMEQLTQELLDTQHSKNEFNFIGDSEPMKRVYNLIRRVGPVDVTVLITGQSGTGKELVAKAIHQTSTRKSAPFVSINCGAISVSLMESELFGHEKGSFTGAIKAHPGCFEQASGGILFLDEVGELDPNVQVKLLRALETKTIRRIGGEKDIPIDIRIITATHRNLEQMVVEKKFREDLYFRLQVIEVNLPPLSERGNDIRLIAEYYSYKISNEMGRPAPAFSDAVFDVLMQYSWPGNVRELKNAIERAIVLSPQGVVDVNAFAHLKIEKNGLFKKEQVIEKTNMEAVLTLKELEKEHILKVLQMVEGNKKKAAEVLGVERKTLYNKLSLYEIDDSTPEP